MACVGISRQRPLKWVELVHAQMHSYRSVSAPCRSLMHHVATNRSFVETQMNVQTSLACVKVPRDLLKDYAIVQAEGTLSGVALPPGVTPAMVQTFSMQERDKTSPTAYEHMAVQRACHQLLSNVSVSFVVACVFSLCTFE